MKHGRTQIICTSCDKQCLNYGNNNCSACLRKHKRRTRPSFYLGTCYSELKRRCKRYDPSRPYYYGLPFCEKQEFINRFLTDSTFINLYKKWQNSNYERKYAPSVDRIDNKKGYLIENLQFITQSENSKKDVYRTAIVIIDKETNLILKFISQVEAAKFLNISPANLCKRLKTNKLNYKRYEINKS